jgi:hypothetical protein
LTKWRDYRILGDHFEGVCLNGDLQILQFTLHIGLPESRRWTAALNRLSSHMEMQHLWEGSIPAGLLEAFPIRLAHLSLSGFKLHANDAVVNIL